MRQDIFLEMSFMTKLEYDNGKFLDYFKTTFGAKIAPSFFDMLYRIRLQYLFWGFLKIETIDF